MNAPLSSSGKKNTITTEKKNGTDIRRRMTGIGVLSEQI
jgi:hypothetical protein